MSSQRRRSQAKEPTKPRRSGKRPSTKLLAASWIATILSAFLLFQAGLALSSDMSGFRSCDANSSGLTVAMCGKQSLNFGDVVLLILFVCSAALLVSIGTAALRITRRMSE